MVGDIDSDSSEKYEAMAETLKRISLSYPEDSAERRAIFAAARALASEFHAESRRQYEEFLQEFPVTDAMIDTALAATANSPEGTMASVHGEMWVLVIDPDGKRRLIRPNLIHWDEEDALDK
ncbi:hypothetical protein LOC68_16415 [Blastopirellula sp. JC732]|uniref:Uncharacterized protein n=1 Tax=Blastopirellula sediminis TaxID=2894196 RepID=A0A9X1MQ58_9BACT|nr:hypothetical protein [Blastopirellula sediminis]MCC9606726.1 hypothetical protein [Blastopirellula sediminis]MCC9629977.1 hypothetical protein [Blastopirellula sediminis]